MDNEATVKRESILRMFRKVSKVAATDSDANNFGLRKSASTIISQQDKLQQDLSMCQLNQSNCL